MLTTTPQFLLAFCVNLSTIYWGANMSITSSLVYSFQKGRDDLIDMTFEEASWMREINVVTMISRVTLPYSLKK